MIDKQSIISLVLVGSEKGGAGRMGGEVGEGGGRWEVGGGGGQAWQET